MSSNELHALAALLGELGADIAETRCLPQGLTATIELSRAAHPTLCAAARRFMAGCPTHHSRICGQSRHHGGHDCHWYNTGQRGVTWPFTPWFGEHETGAPPSNPAGGIAAATQWEVPR